MHKLVRSIPYELVSPFVGLQVVGGITAGRHRSVRWRMRNGFASVSLLVNGHSHGLAIVHTSSFVCFHANDHARDAGIDHKTRSVANKLSTLYVTTHLPHCLCLLLGVLPQRL